jgi:phosphoglycolate phosphatase
VQADAVIFDLDGVLADSRTAFARCVNAALVAAGVPERPAADLHRYLGPPLHATFVELTGDASLAQGCLDAYRARYREHAATETTVPEGMADAVATLAARMPLAVATSKPLALSAPLLEALGLLGHFAVVEGPSLEARAEPKAETIRRALRGLPDGARPVMVGDTRFDVIGAHAHGLPCIGVLWGIGSEDELREAGADVLVATPDELLAVIRWGRCPAGGRLGFHRPPR